MKRHGVEAAAEVGNFEVAHIQAFKKLISEENIDCDLVITRSMNVYLNTDEANQARETYESLAAQGLSFTDDIQYISGKLAEAASGIKDAKACLSCTAGSLWPYKLVTGLLTKLLETGAVNLQTLTPVTSVTSEAPDSHTVHTPRGSIRTKKVVYAANAYTFGLLPEYRESIVPCRGICCHIALPEGQEPPFVSYTYILGTEDRNGSSYLISRPDRTIIVGGAQKSFKGFRNQWYNVVDDSTLIEPARSYYDGYMQRTFKGWDTTDAHVKEIWTGIMGYSYDSLPHVSDIPGRPGQYICGGFDGHGMPIIFLAARGLAQMIRMGKKFEEVNLPRLYKSTAERLRAAQNGKEGGDILA